LGVRTYLRHTSGNEKNWRLIDVAKDLKAKHAAGQVTDYLKNKTFFMIFYNASLRTRNSFEAGMTQLGGHAHDLTVEKVYSTIAADDRKKQLEAGKELKEPHEEITETARVLSRYGHGIGVRVFGKSVDYVYGRGHQMIREYAKYADVPVFNMADDMDHPTQAMADLLTIIEKFHGNVQNKKIVMGWVYAPSPWRQLAVSHSVITTMSKFGMDVVVAHPPGFDLDPKYVKISQEYADTYGGSFKVVNDLKEACEGADVVYAKSWGVRRLLPPESPVPSLEKAKAEFEKHRDWIINQKIMDLTAKNSLYMHCLPVDRGYEVTDEVIDGPHSVVIDEAENRLHVQKGYMALTMGGLP